MKNMPQRKNTPEWKKGIFSFKEAFDNEGAFTFFHNYKHILYFIFPQMQNLLWSIFDIFRHLLNRVLPSHPVL